MKDNDFADAFYYIFTNRDLQISADIQDAYQTSAFCVYKRIREFTDNAVFRIDRDNKSAIREFFNGVFKNLIFGKNNAAQFSCAALFLRYFFIKIINVPSKL